MHKLALFDYKGEVNEGSIATFLQTIKSKTFFSQTFLPPPELDQIMAAMQQAVLAFGQLFDYDLGVRADFLKRVVFVKYADLKTLTKVDFVRAAHLHTANFKIYVAIDDSSGGQRHEAGIAHTLNHEFVHTIAFQQVKLLEGGQAYTSVQSGYRKINAYFLFDEAVCELVNIYIINRFWPHYDATKTLITKAKHAMSYPLSVAFVYALLEKLSEVMHSRLEDVFKIMVDDLLVGSNRFITLCGEKIDQGLVSDLASGTTPDDYDLAVLLTMAHDYKLESFAKRLTADPSSHSKTGLEAVSRFGSS